MEPDEAASEVWTRKRQPKSELRQLMLDTGREILQEEGIETRSSNLTFKRVFDRVERDTGRHLTNASVIKRIWEDQSDYQADVLVSIAQDENRPEVGATMAAVEDVLASTDLSSVEGRLRGMSTGRCGSASWPSPRRPPTTTNGSACARRSPRDTSW